MNIKITIRDAPVLVNHNQLTEIQSKKKNSLYRQPETTKSPKQIAPPKQIKTRQPPSQIPSSSKQKAQKQLRPGSIDKKLMADLDKMSKNQTTFDILKNTNDKIQKQFEITEGNQKALFEMMKQQQSQQSREVNKEAGEILQGVKAQIAQMTRIRDEIVSANRQFNKNLKETKTKPQATKIAGNVTEMNTNLNKLAEISQHKLERLQSIDAVRHIQDFNTEAYQQQINILKKQIMQYQRQSENIERELTLRAQKLKQLEIPANIDAQLIEPYQKNIQKKVDSIDLHAIKERVYEKLGHFDYSAFELQENMTLNEIKQKMSEFYLVCREYQVQVPELGLDVKQLKKLEYKPTSIVEDYKMAHGIVFEESTQAKPPSFGRTSRHIMDPLAASSQKQIIGLEKPKGRKMPKEIEQLKTKPVDYATNVQLRKLDEEKRTILQNQQNKELKKVQKELKRPKSLSKAQNDFDKYLQSRKNEQLQQLFREKKLKLQKMKKQLYNQCQQAVQLDTLQGYVPKSKPNEQEENQIKQSLKEIKKKRQQIKQAQQKQSKIQQEKKHPQEQVIKAIGTEVLKEKLKNIFKRDIGALQTPSFMQSPSFMQPNSGVSGEGQQQPVRLENMAENFINLINNTLTQVNTQLCNTIEAKIQRRSFSAQRKPQFPIPKLQQITLPPAFPAFTAFNMQQTHQQIPTTTMQSTGRYLPTSKITLTNYDHLRVKEDSYADLEASDFEADGPYRSYD